MMVRPLKVLVAGLEIVYYYLEAFVLLFVPSSARQRKSIVGQIALVTGAGSGIGRLTAIRLAKLGARLVLWDINSKGLEETKRTISQEGGEAFAYECDVSDRRNVYEIADRVRADVGHVDILVNNAGIVNGTRFLDTPDDKIDKVMAVNANAHFWTLKAFLPNMVEKNHGHVVTVSSMAGRVGCPKLVDYCASKYAATGLHEALSLELRDEGKLGVHFTNIAPTFINTGMFAGCTNMPGMPLLEPDHVAEQIVDGILMDTFDILVPKSLFVVSLIREFMPLKAQLVMAELMGSSNFMKDFVGRAPASH